MVPSVLVVISKVRPATNQCVREAPTSEGTVFEIMFVYSTSSMKKNKSSLKRELTYGSISTRVISLDVLK